MWGLIPQSGIHPSTLVYLLRPPFGRAAHGVNSQVALHCGLTLASGYVGSVAPREGALCRPRSASAFDFSGLPGRSYEASYKLLLPVLDLEARGRAHAASRGQLLPVLGLRQLSKSPVNLKG